MCSFRQFVPNTESSEMTIDAFHRFHFVGFGGEMESVLRACVGSRRAAIKFGDLSKVKTTPRTRMYIKPSGERCEIKEPSLAHQLVATMQDNGWQRVASHETQMIQEHINECSDGTNGMEWMLEVGSIESTFEWDTINF